MFTILKKSALVSPIVVFLGISGCASVPYELPPNTQTATLKSYLWVSARNNSIDISVKDDEGWKQLFYIYNEEQYETALIEANKPLRLRYYESIVDRYCEIEVEATFKANREYVIVGGAEFTKDIIPILSVGAANLELKTERPEKLFLKQYQISNI